MSDQIGELFGVAREEGDYLSEQFVQWFLKEQVEEVATMTELLDVAERVARLPDDARGVHRAGEARRRRRARTRCAPEPRRGRLASGRRGRRAAGYLWALGRHQARPHAARGGRRDPDQGADAREPPPRGAASRRRTPTPS